MNNPAQTITCGHCGTDMRSFARVCSGCNAVRGVGRLTNGTVVGQHWVVRARLLLSLLLAMAAVFAATGNWEGVVFPGVAAALIFYQTCGVIFSRGREYWFR